MRAKTASLLVPICLLIAACVAVPVQTTPNPSYYQQPARARNLSGPDARAAQLLRELQTKNPLLAKELGKFPEFQDGATAAEVAALERMLALYNAERAAFDTAFAEMYKCGLPHIRQYCALLQALYWLAEDDRTADAEYAIKRYAIGKYQRHAFNHLLYLAWETGRDYASMTYADFSAVAGGIEDQKVKSEYINQLSPKNFTGLKRRLVWQYQNGELRLTPEAGRMLEAAILKNQKRWEDFDVVTARLSSPELVDYYTRQNFSFTFYINNLGSSRYAFKNKGGNGVDIEEFQSYALKKAGYKSERIKVLPVGVGVNWHPITRYWVPGVKGFYLMDNGVPLPKGIMGPYEKFSESIYGMADQTHY